MERFIDMQEMRTPVQCGLDDLLWRGVEYDPAHQEVTIHETDGAACGIDDHRATRVGGSHPTDDADQRFVLAADDEGGSHCIGDLLAKPNGERTHGGHPIQPTKGRRRLTQVNFETARL
jgi:hypothetical protein